MSRQNILTKNFPSATCQHCGKVTNIQFSNNWRQIVSKYKSASEMNKFKEVQIRKILVMKNGQIQAMHKIIAKILELLNNKQKEKVKKISQEMRDELKKFEKEALGKHKRSSQ